MKRIVPKPENPKMEVTAENAVIVNDIIATYCLDPTKSVFVKTGEFICFARLDPITSVFV